MNKKTLSERDICINYITPAIVRAGWDSHKQLLEEVSFTYGKIYVRGRLTSRGARKRADFTKYGEQVRKVLENLLDKYADEGITDIDSTEVLKVKPFTKFGSPIEIIKTCGSKQDYLDALHELEPEIYKTAN